MKTNKATKVKKPEVEIFNGNCLDFLKLCEDNSIDAVVTDPPYGLAFMNKKWDYDVPSVDIWREVLRVLKPGGHVLSFGGTRTYHRMVVNIEDAGFEIRDQIQWLYGSGFPKSHNISKAIDKMAGAEREVVGVNPSSRPNSKVVGNRGFDSALGEGESAGEQKITAPATDAAKLWDGWGSALKPANEPIVLARKPLEKGLTLAANVLKYGTGGLNIDASRIGYSANEDLDFSKVQDGNIYGANGVYGKGEQKQTTPLFKENGRWPANLILDETAASLCDSIFGDKQNPNPSRFFYIPKASKSERNAGLEGMPEKSSSKMGAGIQSNVGNGKPGETSSEDRRSQNFHPTVKPIKLMEYLCTLITPNGGTILDPFMGSGSTGVAAKRLGFNFIGCEMNEEYVTIAEKRINGGD